MAEELGPEPGAPPEPPSLPEPPPPPTRPTGLDLLKALAIIWTALILANIAVAVIFVTLHIMRGKIGFPAIDPRMLLVGAAVDWVVTFCVITYFAAWKYHRTFHDGFYLYRVSARTVFLSVLIGVGGSIVATIVMRYFATGNAPLYDIAFNESEDGIVRMSLVFAFFAVVVPPLEELYYRGFLFPVFSRLLNAKLAIAIVSIWFLSIHVPQMYGEWAAIGVIACMSVVWTLQRHLYGSLWPSLLSHWTYNGCLIVLQLAAEYLMET